ncbi:unnamed protein product [Moneuplotes crassus]|uniref:Uncharacterized protein n=1 Tax=Euplotes crassus TaxID=5936 RepID=A0AAD1XSE1_EUPCR|nr:unnamed protein product [Moneuplotes crassus]
MYSGGILKVIWVNVSAQGYWRMSGESLSPKTLVTTSCKYCVRKPSIITLPSAIIIRCSSFDFPFVLATTSPGFITHSENSTFFAQ